MNRIRLTLIHAGSIRPVSSAARPAANGTVQLDPRACAARRSEFTPTSKIAALRRRDH